MSDVAIQSMCSNNPKLKEQLEEHDLKGQDEGEMRTAGRRVRESSNLTDESSSCGAHSSSGDLSKSQWKKSNASSVLT